MRTTAGTTQPTEEPHVRQEKERQTREAPKLADVDLSAAVDTVETYTRHLNTLQLKLLSLQQRYVHEGRRAIIVFEGWDAAGKGGVIRRINERLGPGLIKVRSRRGGVPR